MIRGWQLIARFILKQRVPILIVIAALTVFWAFQINLELSHNYSQVIPPKDPEYVEYKNFKEEFGEDGNVFIIGLEGNVFQADFLNGVSDLTAELKKAPAVTNVISLANIVELVYDTTGDKFQAVPILEGRVESDEKAEWVREKIRNLPFYDNILLNDSLDATLLLVSIDRERLDTYEKVAIVDRLIELTNAAAPGFNAQPHFSGLPYVRVYTTKKLPKEMIIFLALAVFITAISLFVFFRSFSAVIFPLIVIGIVVVWSLGVMGMLGYKITILSGVLPALITVIGIPNAIYLLTKYHFEFKRTNNKIKSLVLVIQKIGIVTVMTNATTAVGFLVLVITDITILREFGLVAGISVLITFVVSLLTLPVLYSFLPPPSSRHVKHTESWITRIVIRGIDRIVKNARWAVYLVALALVTVSVFGVKKLESSARMVDEIPEEDSIYQDLSFLEANFKGAMPFEIVINTHKPDGVFNTGNLKRIERAQNLLAEYDEISRSISIVDLIKFARQSWLSGVSSEFQLPIPDEAREIGRIYKNSSMEGDLGVKAIFDSLKSKARITAQVKDIGSKRLAEITDSLYPALADLFVRNVKSGNLEEGEEYELYGPETFAISYAGTEYHGGDRFFAGVDTAYSILSDSTVKGKLDFADRVKITGTTKIFIRSNEYLVSNLIQSLIIAFVIIAILMALLFGSPKMVLIALFPNFLPLLLTAALMGYFGLPLKASSALVFSVAFGIAVDDTIHYLARYRLARKTGDNIAGAVSNSFKDTGVSMIYTSIILLFGFIIFAFSTYGGIKTLGKLTSLTIGIALFSNLLLLPSLLRTFNKDDEELPDGMIDYESEKEEVEALNDLIGSENGEDIADPEPKEIP